MKRVLIVLALLMVVASCHTTRPVMSNSTVKVADTSTTIDTNLAKVVLKDLQWYSHTEKDTTVGVAGDDVSLVEATDATPDTTIKKGNTTLTTYTDNKGKRHIECKTDSLTLVIAKLRNDSSYQSHKYDSLAFIKTLTLNTHDSSSLKEVVLEENKGWFAGLLMYAKDVLAIVGLVALVFIIVRIYLKRTI